MPYFPESIVSARMKSESSDVVGNKFIISAADMNRHDEEIRAIEKIIGVRQAKFPTGISTFSGVSGGSGSQPCSHNVVNDIFSAIENIVDLLQRIRDGAILLTSGVISKYDGPNAFDPKTAKIVFPTHWPMTTLPNGLEDHRVDPDFPLPNLDYIELPNVDDMPDAGYITIINDVSMMSYEAKKRIVHLPGYTSLATTDSPIYNVYDIAARIGGNSKLDLPDTRIFGVDTNVEYISYDGIDTANKRILNCRRSQLGSMATKHAPDDIVFKGIASIKVGPLMYKIFNGKSLDSIECILRSNGNIDLEVRGIDNKPPDYVAQTLYGWVHYSAMLVREIEPIPAYVPPTTNANEDGACS